MSIYDARAMLPITGPNCEPIHSRTDNEPNPGSVVLTHGEWGTGWQRHFADGLWHRMGSNPSRPKTWGWLCAQRNLVLVYDARERLGHPAPEPSPHSADSLGLHPIVQTWETGKGN